MSFERGALGFWFPATGFGLRGFGAGSKISGVPLRVDKFGCPASGLGVGVHLLSVECSDPVPVGRTHMAIVKSCCGAWGQGFRGEGFGFW